MRTLVKLTLGYTLADRYRLLSAALAVSVARCLSVDRGLALECGFDVIAECEAELGRRGYDAPQADRGSDRDEDPDDLLKARS